MASTNDITGDSIRTKASTDAYREGHDRIFGKKAEPYPYKGAVCRGDKGLGTACGKCEKCQQNNVLLSCPFCGSNDISAGECMSLSAQQTGCLDCGALGPLVPIREDYSTADCDKAWNTRVKGGGKC